MIGGGLTNSGSMPISAGGGDSGDATATNKASFGGIKQGAINMGGGNAMSQLPMVVVVSVLFYVMVKK